MVQEVIVPFDSTHGHPAARQQAAPTARPNARPDEQHPKYGTAARGKQSETSNSHFDAGEDSQRGGGKGEGVPWDWIAEKPAMGVGPYAAHCVGVMRRER